MGVLAFFLELNDLENALNKLSFSLYGNSIYHEWQYITIDGQVHKVIKYSIITDDVNTNAMIDFIGVKSYVILIVNCCGFGLIYSILAAMSAVISVYKFLRDDILLAKMESEKFKNDKWPTD